VRRSFKALKLFFLLGGLLFYLSFIVKFSYAVPMGGDVTFLSSDAYTASPKSRTDDGATINTIIVSVQQQNDAWKAYVGNVTGKYVLRNSNNFSIYEWPLSANITGEVYLSRNNSVNFSAGAVVCANNSALVAEQVVFGMAEADTDNINNTFNTSDHSSFRVGSTLFNQDDCAAIALWVNNTPQTPGSTALFQQIALYDGHTVFYASLINKGKTGFDNTTTYDFQAIVAENRSAAAGTAYYFYVELGS